MGNIVLDVFNMDFSIRDDIQQQVYPELYLSLYDSHEVEIACCKWQLIGQTLYDIVEMQTNAMEGETVFTGYDHSGDEHMDYSAEEAFLDGGH